MQCPRCDLPLSSGAPSWCKECNGCWASATDIAEKVKPHEKSTAWSVRGESKLGCPACSTKMDEVLHAPTSTVVDRCKPHGIWFDVGEIKRVTGKGSAEAPPPAPVVEGRSIVGSIADGVVGVVGVVGGVALGIGELFVEALSELSDVLDA